MNYLGKVYTPENVIVWARDLLLPFKRDAKVLEPSCGDGRWIKHLNVPHTQCHLYDLDPVAIKSVKETLPQCKIHHKDFLLENVQQKFDLIVGNPPWVSCNYSKQSIQTHAYSSKKANTAFLFTEKCIDLLNDGGQLLFLLPHSINDGLAFEETRRKILRCGLVSMHRIHFHVFKGVSFGTTVIHLKKGYHSKSSVFEYLHSLDAPKELLTTPWQSKTSQNIDRLGDHFIVKDGINLGPAEFKKEHFRIKIEDNDPLWMDACEGKDIFPNKPITPRVQIKVVPLTTLQKKKGTSYRRNLYLDGRPKLLYRQTANKPIVTLDTKGLLPLNSCHAIFHPKDCLKSLITLMDYLNSKEGEVAYGGLSSFKKTFPQILVKTMKSLPLDKSIIPK